MKNKIIVITRSIPSHNSGGLDIVTWDMCEGLARSGSDIELVTTKLPTNSEIVNSSKIKIVELDNTKVGKYSYSWWKGVSRYIDSKNEENIQAVISVSAAGYSGLKHKKKLKETKFIMQAHGTSLDEFKTKIRSGSFVRILKSIKNAYWLIKDIYFYRKFDYIIGIGDTVIDSLKNRPYDFFIDSDKLVKIENGIDDQLFAFDINERERTRHLLGITSNTSVIISVSRLHEQKGIDNNLNTLSVINKKYPNLKLKYIIVGDGREMSKLQKMAFDLGIDDVVLFVGDKKREEIASLLNASDLFLFLTKRIEGLPLNVLEAQCSGLPMVISKHLLFNECEKVSKVEYDDFSLATELVVKALSNSTQNVRQGYISEINKLSYSTSSYLDLINRV